MTEYINAEVGISELCVGDVIKLSHDPFGTAIVKNVTETEVTFFRPYGTTADFTHTGGVICYVGIEEFSLPRSRSDKFHVYSRPSLR